MMWDDLSTSKLICTEVSRCFGRARGSRGQPLRRPQAAQTIGWRSLSMGAPGTPQFPSSPESPSAWSDQDSVEMMKLEDLSAELCHRVSEVLNRVVSCWIVTKSVVISDEKALFCNNFVTPCKSTDPYQLLSIFVNIPNSNFPCSFDLAFWCIPAAVLHPESRLLVEA